MEVFFVCLFLDKYALLGKYINGLSGGMQIIVKIPLYHYFCMPFSKLLFCCLSISSIFYAFAKGHYAKGMLKDGFQYILFKMLVSLHF